MTSIFSLSAEISLTVIIIVLLLADLILKEPNHKKLQGLACILMLIQLIVNIQPADAEAFGGMFRTTPMISVVKTILNSPFVELITPYFHFNLITVDPDDNKFVDCAISANARYIVTNDRHYDVLKSIDFPNVDVINIKQFCLELDCQNI